MYGDTTYGNGDTSWMTEDPPTPAASTPKKAPSPAVSNEPSWMRGDPAPDQNSGAFGANTFDDETNEVDGDDGGGGGWSDVSSSRYQGNDSPDWMKPASRRTTTNSSSSTTTTTNNNNNNNNNEFGAGDYRKEEVRFDGADDYHSHKQQQSSTSNNSNQSNQLGDALLPGGSSSRRTKKRNVAANKNNDDREACGECCQSNWSVCAVVLLLLCGALSMGLFVMSLVQEFGVHPNVVGAPVHGKNNTSLSLAAAAAAATAGVSTSLNSCSEKDGKCMGEGGGGTGAYKECAFQYQYIDTSGKRLCGSESCRTLSGSAPPGWYFPLAFKCPDFPMGTSFECGAWPWLAMLWRVLSTCGGFIAACMYLYIIRRCKSCVSCSLWLTNVLMFGHAVVAFICMVQDSIAVSSAQKFCNDGLLVPGGSGGGGGSETLSITLSAAPKMESVCAMKASTSKGGEPTCMMSQYVFVCLCDAGLGVLWLISGYAMCKLRSARRNKD